MIENVSKNSVEKVRETNYSDQNDQILLRVSVNNSG